MPERFFWCWESNGKTIAAKIFINGQPAGKNSGIDVHENQVIVTKDTLYEVVSLSAFDEGLLEIETMAPGLQAYAIYN